MKRKTGDTNEGETDEINGLPAGGSNTFSAGAVPALADETKSNADLLPAGFSLALTDIETDATDELSEDIQREAEEAAAAQAAAEQAEAEAYAKTGVAVVNDYVNVRSGSSEDSEIVGRMENHAVAQVEGEENGWYRITSGSISGYVKADYLTVGDRELIVLSESGWRKCRQNP